MTQLIVSARVGSSWVARTLSPLETRTLWCDNVTGSSYITNLSLLKPLGRSFLNNVNDRGNSCSLYYTVSALFFFNRLTFLVMRATRKTIRKLSFNPKHMSIHLFSIPSVKNHNHSSFRTYQLENTKNVSLYHGKNQIVT